MRRATGILTITFGVLVAGNVLQSHAGLAVPSALNSTQPEEQLRQAELDADLSNIRKLQVGKQRYEQRQAFRQSIVDGMRAGMQERRQEITGQPMLTTSPTAVRHFDPTNLVLGLLALAAGFLAFHHVKKSRLEELGCRELPGNAGRTASAALRKASPAAGGNESEPPSTLIVVRRK